MMSSIAQRLTGDKTGSKRLDWADNAKAILITLVVIGHFGKLSPVIKQIIYAFHVPAFLFLTGYLLPQALRSMSTRQFAQKYIGPYVRLTLFFISFSILLWWVWKGRASDVGQVWDVIVNGFYGSQSRAQRFLHGNGPLWYLPFLVSSFLALLVAIRLPRYASGLLIAVYAIFSLTYQGPRWPWSLDIAGIGLLFILAGHWTRAGLGRLAVSAPGQNGIPGPLSMRDRAILLILAGGLAVTTVGLAYLNGRTNINVLLFGRNPVLLVAAALSGTMMTMLFSLSLPGSVLARHLSHNTLVIFCIHIFLVREVSSKLHIGNKGINLIAVVLLGILITIICAYVSRLVMPYIDRYIIGRKPAAPSAVSPAR